MNLDTLIQEYFLYVRHERGLAKRTFAVYQAWLHQFQRSRAASLSPLTLGA